MNPPIHLPSRSPRALALAFVPIGLTAGGAFAAESPLRVAYVDVDGAEQEKAGVLHNAMRENGRRAIYFDYFHSPQALTAELQPLYNAVVVRGDAADKLSALHPEKRVVFIPEGQSPEAVRNAVLKTVSDAARKDWVAFLAQREEEVREKNENVANYEKTLIQALNEVADVAAGLQQLQKQVRLADQSVAAQTQGLTVAANRYRGGLANYLDVLVAEDELLTSWRVQTDVRTRAFILDVALTKALGGGYQLDSVTVRQEDKKSEELPQ